MKRPCPLETLWCEWESFCSTIDRSDGHSIRDNNTDKSLWWVSVSRCSVCVRQTRADNCRRRGRHRDRCLALEHKHQQKLVPQLVWWGPLLSAGGQCRPVSACELLAQRSGAPHCSHWLLYAVCLRPLYEYLPLWPLPQPGNQWQHKQRTAQRRRHTHWPNASNPVSTYQLERKHINGRSRVFIEPK